MAVWFRAGRQREARASAWMAGTLMTISWAAQSVWFPKMPLKNFRSLPTSSLRSTVTHQDHLLTWSLNRAPTRCMAADSFSTVSRTCRLTDSSRRRSRTSTVSSSAALSAEPWSRTRLSASLPLNATGRKSLKPWTPAASTPSLRARLRRPSATFYQPRNSITISLNHRR